ncbi:MAG TPA: tetratricopeptide repeat protein [Vicinamibacteria bacterium]|nr:tetratricopeptide repeat protein [Vicinamibacteria bacterium]
MPEPIPRGPFDQGLFLAHYNKGRELLEARKFDEAERQLEEAYLLRPRDPRVLNLLGLVYFRGDKLGKAEEVYRKLITESPDAHTLHYNLGLICFKQGRLEDAESAFLKALELTGDSPKIRFYLGSIYERLQRYKDAIHQYRQAGAHIMVQRLQGRLDRGGRGADATAPPGTIAPPPPEAPPDTKPPMPAPRIPDVPSAEAAEPEPDAPGPAKSLGPLSPSLMAGEGPLPGAVRFEFAGDTLPAPSRSRASVPAAAAAPEPPTREVFRGLGKGLMEVEFSGKVFIKQGTIYSYSGNLTFWVKDKRPGARPLLVIVTGTGRLILADHERDLTFMQVADEPVYVEPAHLLACEEGLQPRYVRFGDEATGVEVVALEGRGMVALSVASKPLPLTVNPALPVSVPATSVIMWTGQIEPHVVDDPEVYAVVLPSAAGSGRLLRLEGTGRVLVEQAAV